MGLIPFHHTAGCEKHRHGPAGPCIAITNEAGSGEKTSETASRKIFDALPGPGGEGGIKNEECGMKSGASGNRGRGSN